MTAIEVYNGSIGESIVVFGNLAAQIAKTEFVPEAFRNRPEAVLACMLFGQECGLGPMASLNLTQSIKGKVGLKPEGMRAVVQAHGHRIWTEEYTDETVVLCGQRRGEEHVERVAWTLADAKRAGLTQANGSWSKYPRAMLLARATSELCRLLFSDVTGGIAYGPDELEEMTAGPQFGRAPELPETPRQQHVSSTRPPERAEVVDTPELPPSTGTRKRKPPIAAPVVAEPIVLASDEDRDAIATILKRYSANVAARDALMAKWADAGIASFKAVERFTAGDAAKALDLLAEFQTSWVEPEQPTLDGDAA